LGDPFAQDLNRAPPAGGRPAAGEAAPAAEALPPLQLTEIVPPTAGAAPPSGSEDGVRILPLTQVRANPGQPRRHFDDAQLQELADSIRAHGVLQPILVRPVAGHAERFEIVAGERRWRAAQMAGLQNIPAQVRSFEDRDTLEVAIIENVQRSDLNPIEEALGYQALMERFGRTQADVAERVGKSRPHIANMLRLLHLPEEIQVMVREGKLSAGHARAVLSAPNTMELAKLAVAQALSVRDVERLAQKAKEAALAPPSAAREAPSSAEDGDLLALERSLSTALGMKVLLQRQGEGGELRVKFTRPDQLDELCRRLSAA
jgi:ParB family chromosome partitioning protein